MVKHSQLFMHSLFQPNKLAAYRLLTIGKVIQYVFILVTVVTIFSFVQFLTGVTDSTFDLKGLQEYLKDIQWLLYPFALIVIFLESTILLFVIISIYAFIGTFFLKIMQRRGEYRHMWRTSAFAITWSTLLLILLPFIHVSSWIGIIFSIIITISLLIIASLKYPKIVKK